MNWKEKGKRKKNLYTNRDKKVLRHVDAWQHLYSPGPENRD
jgi:hypothetical protein